MALRIRPSSCRTCKSFLPVRYYSAPADGSIPPSKRRFVPDEVSIPKGFSVGSAHAGVKPSNTSRDDVAIIASDQPCTALGWFTKNAFSAAPVAHCKQVLEANKRRGVRGVVINSGCANAVTGEIGLQDAQRMSQAVDKLLPIEEGPSSFARTLVMSTGVIGQRLPIDKILDAIPRAQTAMGSDQSHWHSVAKAIMTTDTFPKIVSRTFTLPSHPDTTYTMTGIVKGAGMIHPNLGTLLSVICTDVGFDNENPPMLGTAPITSSFNSITIDGDTSTNDSVVLLANGAATPSDARKLSSVIDDDATKFRQVATHVMRDLAKLVVRDGEGATKFITIRVFDAKDVPQARRIAKQVATSALVKTAMYGKDANWGRILCAIGNADKNINPNKITVSLGIDPPETTSTTGSAENVGDALGVWSPGETLDLVKNGQPCTFTDEDAKPYIDGEEVNIYIRLGEKQRATAAKVAKKKELKEKYGKEYKDRDSTDPKQAQAAYYTCDFSHEYVTINADYRT